MDFNPSKTPVECNSIEMIKEGAFGGTYFRDLYFNINKCDAKFDASDYYHINVNKYGVKCGTSLRLRENKGWINKIEPYIWIQWYFRYWLGRRSKDDKRQINRWKKIVSGFGGKLEKMIKNSGSKYDNYSISPKIRQILLHWGY